MRQLDASILTGIHSGQWASGRAAGGILALDREREKRRGIDLTRGAFWQMHAGRMRVWRVLDLGVASCEIPHVVGAELSTALKRGRERRYGAGPEVRLTIPSLHARVGVRYERDSLAGSRSQGQAVVLSLALLEWRGK
jgi:hypothetical protein